MPAEINIFLLLFGGLQGIFLSVLLLKKKMHQNGYFFLVIYLSIMVLQIVLKVMSKVWLLDNLRPLYLLSYQFPFVYGALVYLFVRQFLMQQKFRAIDTLHFFPLTVIIVYFIFGNLYTRSPLILQPFFSPVPRLILELLSIAVYHLLAWQYWLTHQSQLKSFFLI